MTEWTFPPGFKPYDYHFWDEPYLKSAGPNFAGVFVAFHPFRRLHPYGGDIFWWPEDGFIDEAHPDPARRMQTSYEKAHVTEVLWTSVIREVGLGGPHEIDCAYRTYYKRLKDWALRPDLLGRLEGWCKQTTTYFPEEDRLPPSFERRIAHISRKIGVERLCFGSTFYGDWSDVAVAELEKSNTSFRFENIAKNTLFAPNHEFVLITLVDNTYSLIAVTPQVMSAVDIASIFEGFWATEKTCEEWKVDPINFGVGPVTTPKWTVVDGKVSHPGLHPTG